MDEHGLFLPCNIAGIIAVLALFLNELRDPNKLDTMAEPHDKPQTERVLFYIAICINIFFQCLYIGIYLSNVNSDIKTDMFGGSSFLFGLLICIFGSFLRLRAKQKLGRFFTYQLGVCMDQKLINTGVYTNIRHPSYLGLLLLFIGSGVMHYSAILLLTSVQMFVSVLIRVAKEEIMLADKFGADFERYCEKRWKLLPYVW